MKQTAVDLIFESFNLLSDKDYKTWMLHTYDYLKKMEKQQIINAYGQGVAVEAMQLLDVSKDAEQYYNEFYILNNKEKKK
jgi:hypothetical protein